MSSLLSGENGVFRALGVPRRPNKKKWQKWSKFDPKSLWSVYINVLSIVPHYTVQGVNINEMK